jgi:recombination protein RecR
MAVHYAESFVKLIDEFQKMPGIGPKSAQRLSFYVLGLPVSEADKLSEAIKEVKRKIKHCSRCFNITEHDPCKICSNGGREHSTICVVAEPKDMIAVEKTGGFKGLYHILGGLISPLDGVEPDSLRIKELLARIDSDVREIVLAINPSIEGEATTGYLMKLIRPTGVRLTRIAYGLPIGSEMDYADEVTLTKSFEGRREVS